MQKPATSLLLLLLLSGCTTTLYTGRFVATDSAGKEQPFVVYWNATEPLIGERKASPVTVLPCYPRTLQFEEQPAPPSSGAPSWIVFRGEPGQDQPVASVPQLADGICGRILNAPRVADLDGAELQLTITCEAAAPDEFSTLMPYLKARTEPYRVTILQRETDDLNRDTPQRESCIAETAP